MDQIRVLIADDHPAARKGIWMFLRTEQSIHIVGEAEDCQDTVEKAIRLRPDVVLMDLLMPKGCGVEAIAEIRRCLPEVKIIVLTMVSDERVVRAAMEAGANAYVLKDADGEALLRAVDKIQREGSFFDMRQRPCKKLSQPNDSGGGKLLTGREKEILRLVARGMTNQDVAQVLDISENTVKAHVSHILDRLGVSDRTQAAVWAAQLGLISPR
jgi:DNA-binding NarL/FixJ family response regulator